MKPIDVYIYKLDLNVEKPVVEQSPAEIRESSYGDAEVICWIGPNDYSVWHSAFDTRMLGVVNEPLDNVVELIIKRDETSEGEAIKMIEDYCSKKAEIFRKKINMFYRGIGATIRFRLFKNAINNINPPIPPISREEFMQKASFSAPIDITDSCEGCKHIGLWENEYEYGISCPCLKCRRRTKDNYEPKGESNERELQ